MCIFNVIVEAGIGGKSRERMLCCIATQQFKNVNLFDRIVNFFKNITLFRYIN